MCKWIKVYEWNKWWSSKFFQYKKGSIENRSEILPFHHIAHVKGLPKGGVLSMHQDHEIKLNSLIERT
jgi:hypothetical protein